MATIRLISVNAYGSTPSDSGTLKNDNSGGCYGGTNPTSRVNGYIRTRFRVSSDTYIKEIKINKLPIHVGWLKQPSDLKEDGSFAFDATSPERVNRIHYTSTSTSATYTNIYCKFASKDSTYFSKSVTSTALNGDSDVTVTIENTSVTQIEYDIVFDIPYIYTNNPLYDWESGGGYYYYVGANVRLGDLLNPSYVTVTEDSYDISTTLAVDGEEYISSEGQYRINGDQERTISYSAQGDHVTSWALSVDGTNIQTGTSPVMSSSEKYTFPKKPYAETTLVKIKASNSSKSSTSLGYYHVGGVPDINTIQPIHYDYIHPQTPDTSITHSVMFSGKYYSQLSSFSSWGAYTNNSGLTYISVSNTYYNSNSGEIQTTYQYKLTTTPGYKYVYCYFNDSKYGRSSTVYADIYVCIHPSVSLSGNTTPNVGESVTITNTSSENTSVTNRYNWYTIKNNVRTKVLSGVAKSSTYSFTPSDTTPITIEIEGYDNLHSGYTSKPSNSIVINPVSPVPKPTVNYDPSTFYYADNVNLSIIESFEPEVEISYQWYINGSAVSGATDKTYTLTNIRSSTTVYVKSTYGSLTETSETVTLTPSSPAPSTSTSYSPSTLYGNYTKLNVRCYVTSKLSNCEITGYSIEVRKTNSTGEIVHSNSVTTSALEYTFEIPVLPPGIYYIKNNKYFTYTGTSGNTYSSFQYGTSTKTYSAPVPIPSFTILTSSPVSEGQAIECVNETIDIGIPATFEWMVNGVVKSTDRNLNFIAETGVSLYSIQLVAKNGSYRASSTTKTISVTEYYNPMTRWTIVITDGNTNHAIFSRTKFVSDGYTSFKQTNDFVMLKYEHRLDEVGLGSVTIMCNDSNSIGAIKSGSIILIYDNNYLAYQGIITSAEQRNNIGIGVSIPSESFVKRIYDVEFAEYTRSLTYKLPLTTGTVSGTAASIMNSINQDTVVVDSSNLDYGYGYSFNIDNSNVLSQIDSFCEQFNAVYRMVIYRTRVDNVTHNIASRTITVPSVDIVNNAKYFFYRDSEHIFFAIIYKSGTQYKYDSNKYTYCGNGWTTSSNPVAHSCFASDSKVVLASSFYQQSGSVIFNSPLKINSTCYDVNNDYKQEKLYGSIVVSSPTVSSKNVSCKTSLYKKVNSDGNSSMFGFNIIESHDCVIVKADMSKFGAQTGINIYVEGDYMDSIYYVPVWRPAGYFLYARIPRVSSVQQTTIIVNGIEKNVWYIPEAIDSTVYDTTPESLIGTIIRNGVYTLNKTGFPTDSDIYIGGEHIIGSYSVSGTTLTINSLDSSAYGKRDRQYGHLNSIPVYTSMVEAGAPIQLYPDKSLSVTCQDGLNYMQLEVLLFNLVRYNSNFTSTVSGSCALKHWTDNEYRFPYVGDHVSIQSLETGAPVLDLECQSYTINADEMKCDFNLGMKPITIGDIVYRIKQNQMTNISN